MQDICVDVTENEMMSIGRKEVHMDRYDKCGTGEGWGGVRGWSMATTISKIQNNLK